MKKTLTAFLTAALAFTAGCSGSAGTDTSKDQLARIREAGKVTVANEAAWRPWCYEDESGKLVGFDVEVSEKIAEYLGVDIEFQAMDFDSCLEAVKSGRIDFVANGVDATEDRRSSFDFSDPYCYNDTVLVVLKSNTDIKSYADLAGKTTANSTGSTYAKLGEDNGARVNNVDTMDMTITELRAGRADATINAMVSVLEYVGYDLEGSDLKVVDSLDERMPVSIPLKKGDDSASLREEINKAIAQMRADGTLKALSEKYFKEDITEN